MSHTIHLEKAIEYQFRGNLVKKNIDLVKTVYDKVEIYNVDIPYDSNAAEKPQWNHIELNYQGAKDYEIGAVWYTPGASKTINTGSWGSYTIFFDPKYCIQCQRCFFICPDMAIKREQQSNGEWNVVGTDMNHCKGCRLCVEICPGKDGIKARSAKLKQEGEFK